MKIKNALFSKKRLFIVPISFAILSTGAISETPPSSFIAQPVATLQWGTKTKQVALSRVPANNFGPQSLAVDDLETSLYLLDATNQKIVVVSLKNNEVSSIPLPSDAVDDMCLLGNDRFYLLFGEEKKIVVYRRTSTIVKTLSIDHDIMPISVRCFRQQKIMIEAFDGHFYNLNEQKPLDFIPLEQYQFFIKHRNSTEWNLQGKSLNKTQDVLIKSRHGTLESINLIGIDQRDNLYLTIEESIVEKPTAEKVVRLLRKYTPNGELIAEAELPYSLYAYTLKDIVVTASGRLFQILPLREDLEIVEWRVALNKNAKGQKDSQSTYYRNLFSSLKERPDDFYPSEAPNHDSAPRSQPKDWPNVTPQEMIAKAKEYVNYQFRVTTDNLTTQSGQNLGGKLVITPIRKAGTYTGIPYKWGGDDDLESFQSGLRAGKKAGDRCTFRCSSTYSASDEAVGIDCSGFISRVWNLSGKRSTRDLPDISTLLPSKSALQPGDILNKFGGHVRLFSHQNASGHFFVYEATGNRNDWKVVGHSYNLSELQSYEPYRYRSISDSPVVSPGTPTIFTPFESLTVPPKIPVGNISTPPTIYPKIPVNSIKKTVPPLEEPLAPKKPEKP